MPHELNHVLRLEQLQHLLWDALGGGLDDLLIIDCDRALVDTSSFQDLAVVNIVQGSLVVR
eukprot:CAMPEP_0202914520 /NCGR_PEP_ID=MMETSP1392-20130828/63269_1 /ASSEMBLY_ACC=CAM_ASM_000868 /TAXON_ID=225041 /ORGANISM="Chlamydomonas chlamydogama, Strain SAG 11-48b" /LENGTH=60 /DNA_ID=CAMNT_0049606189 /DNA_START=123 /DNA_END=305 /DNA_ORIENTATION=+